MTRRSIRAALVSWSLLLISNLAFVSTTQAATNTVEIAVNTAKALPSCLKYKVKGVCTWLKCSAFPPKCSIKTSMRVEHFVPEVVVSTWHEAGAHPWADYGRLLASGMNGVGSAFIGLPIDSAGSHSPGDRTDRNHLFRDADAIGNPLGTLNFVLSGSWPNLTTPSKIPFPNPSELSKFPSTMGSIGSSWSSVPATVANGSLAQIKQLADVPAKIASIGGQIAALPGKISNIQSQFGKVSDLMNSPSNIPGVSSLSPTGGLPALSSLFDAGGLGIVDGLFCPPTSLPFGLHYQSLLDAFFWRNVIPAELIYPDSWIPGYNEVGNFPSNTWGSLFPRSGEITQQLPIKGSAVLAQRVASFISRPAQPHIYSLLTTKGSNFRYFQSGPINPNDPSNSTWQRLYPNASKSCEAFGSNDSASLTSWGDGNSSSEESYAWNLWRKMECCKKAGNIYLGSVTW